MNLRSRVIDVVRPLHASGMTTMDIASECGFTYRQVWDALRHAGLPPIKLQRLVCKSGHDKAQVGYFSKDGRFRCRICKRMRDSELASRKRRWKRTLDKIRRAQ